MTRFGAVNKKKKLQAIMMIGIMIVLQLDPNLLPLGYILLVTTLIIYFVTFLF